MYVLALDTALGAVSAAILAPGEERVVAQETALMERGHAEALMPLVRRVLDQSGIAFADIARFAVTIGPGSFTGLRIGISAARGFGLIHQRPLSAFPRWPPLRRRCCSRRIARRWRRPSMPGMGWFIFRPLRWAGGPWPAPASIRSRKPPARLAMAPWSSWAMPPRGWLRPAVARCSKPAGCPVRRSGTRSAGY